MAALSPLQGKNESSTNVPYIHGYAEQLILPYSRQIGAILHEYPYTDDTTRALTPVGFSARVLLLRGRNNTMQNLIKFVVWIVAFLGAYLAVRLLRGL